MALEDLVDQLDEVGERPAQPVDLVADDRVDLALLDITDQALQGGAVEGVKYSAGDGVLWVTPIPELAMPRQCRFTHHVLGVYRDGRIFKIDTRSGTVIYDQTGWTGSSTPRHFWDGQTGSLLMSDGGIHQFPQRVSRQTVGLGEVVTALCARGGLSGSDLDVTELTDEVRGYGVARQVSLRGALELLAVAYNFDCVESDHKLRFRKRGRPVSRVIAEAELAPINDQGELFSETRAQDVDLPVRFTVRYSDEERDGDIGTQTVKRISAPSATMHSRNEATLDLPLTLTPTEAKEIGLRQCFRAWAERTSHEWHLAWTHLDVDPGDVVTIALEDGRSLTVRVVKVDIGADLELALETVVEESSTTMSRRWGAAASGSGGASWRPRPCPASWSWTHHSWTTGTTSTACRPACTGAWPASGSPAGPAPTCTRARTAPSTR
jgi:Putative phage tail protein